MYQVLLFKSRRHLCKGSIVFNKLKENDALSLGLLEWMTFQDPLVK